MNVQVTVSLTEAEAERAHRLVDDGRYPSLDAVMQEGLHRVLDDADADQDEVARPWEEDKEAFRAFIEERLRCPFISNEEARRRTEAMMARVRAEYGLSD